MELPLSAQPCLAYFNSDYGSVQVQSTTTSASVVSWLDWISGTGASQLTVAAQPTLSVASGVHNNLTFGGSAALSFDSLATKVGESFMAFIVAATANHAATNQTFLAFGDSTSSADGYIRLYGNSSAVGLSAGNDSGVGATTTAGTLADNNAHVFTLIKDASGFKVRLDGTQIISVAIAAPFTKINTFTFGALNANGSLSDYLTGSIYEAAIFKGVPSSTAQVDTAVENYFINKYTKGLYRTV